MSYLQCLVADVSHGQLLKGRKCLGGGQLAYSTQDARVGIVVPEVWSRELQLSQLCAGGGYDPQQIRGI
jgi:hypothetical protein